MLHDWGKTLKEDFWMAGRLAQWGIWVEWVYLFIYEFTLWMNDRRKNTDGVFSSFSVLSCPSHLFNFNLHLAPSPSSPSSHCLLVSCSEDWNLKRWCMFLWRGLRVNGAAIAVAAFAAWYLDFISHPFIRCVRVSIEQSSLGVSYWSKS